MDSLTKNRQSPETIRLMMEKAFGAEAIPAHADAISEFTHGLFSATYRVSLADGRTVVLKIAPSPAVEVMTYERNLMENELEAMRLIKANSRIDIPDVLFVDRSRDLCDAPWFFMSFIDGVNLGESVDQQELTPEEAGPLLAELGALNRSLNSIEGRGFGPVSRPAHDRWSVAFASLMDDALADADRTRVDLGNLATRLRADVSAAGAMLDEVTVPRFVEWDLWPSNAILSDGTLSLIDHERALFGDPLMEACFIGIDLPMLGDWRDFVRGYGEIELTPAARTRRRLYTAYLLVVMVVEPRFRGPQDPAQASWSFERLVELVEALER